jgi:hypothetical protein
MVIFNYTTADDGITTPITKESPPMVELSTSDVVVFNDGTVTPLTGATFHFLWW